MCVRVQVCRRVQVCVACECAGVQVYEYACFCTKIGTLIFINPVSMYGMFRQWIFRYHFAVHYGF